MIFSSNKKPIKNETITLIIKATFLFIRTAIIIAPNAKGIAKKQLSVDIEGNALLTAFDMKIPTLIINICNTIIILKTSKSTLERSGIFSQFLVRHKYIMQERNCLLYTSDAADE